MYVSYSSTGEASSTSNYWADNIFIMDSQTWSVYCVMCEAKNNSHVRIQAWIINFCNRIMTSRIAVILVVIPIYLYISRKCIMQSWIDIVRIMSHNIFTRFMEIHTRIYGGGGGHYLNYGDLNSIQRWLYNRWSLESRLATNIQSRKITLERYQSFDIIALNIFILTFESFITMRWRIAFHV